MAKDKFHCEECAGKAKAKGEECFTCDGEGNLKKKVESSKKKK
jgi:DnaJ-class molecular chaperone